MVDFAHLRKVSNYERTKRPNESPSSPSPSSWTSPSWRTKYYHMSQVAQPLLLSVGGADQEKWVRAALLWQFSGFPAFPSINMIVNCILIIIIIIVIFTMVLIIIIIRNTGTNNSSNQPENNVLRMQVFGSCCSFSESWQTSFWQVSLEIVGNVFPIKSNDETINDQYAVDLVNWIL